MERERYMSEGSVSVENTGAVSSSVHPTTEGPAVASRIPELTTSRPLNPSLVESNRPPQSGLEQSVTYSPLDPQLEGPTPAPIPRPFENLFITPEYDPAKFDTYEKRYQGPYVTLINPDTKQEIARLRSLRGISGGSGVEAENSMESLDVITAEGGRVKIEWPKKEEDKIARMREILLRVENSGVADGGVGSRRAVQQLELVINALVTDSRDPEKARVGMKMFEETSARLTLHAAFLEFSVATDGEKVMNAVRSLQATHLNFFFHDMDGFWEGFQFYDQNALEYLLEGRSGRAEEFNQRARKAIIKGDSYSAGLAAQSAQLTSERLWQLTFRRAAKDILVNKDTLMPATEEDRKSGNVDFLGNPKGGNNCAVREIQFQEWLYKQKNELKLVDEQIHLMDGVGLGAEEFFVGLPEKIETYYKEILTVHYSKQVTSPQDSMKVREQAEWDAEKIAIILTGAQKIKKEGEKKPVWPKDSIDISKFKRNTKDWDLEKASSPEEKAELQRQKEELESILGSGNVPRIDFSIYGSLPFADWSFFQVGKPDIFRKALVENPAEGLIRNPTKENLFKVGAAIDTKWKEKGSLLVNTVNFLRKHNQKLGRKNLSFFEANNIVTEGVQNGFINKHQFREVDRKSFGWERVKILGAFFNLWGFIAGILNQFSKEILKVGK